MGIEENDDLIYADEALIPTHPQEKPSDATPWKVLIIDDEEVIHAITRMVFTDYRFNGRRLNLISGYSGRQAKQLIEEHPDAAVILLDVVMESDNAGLQVVDHIRNTLKNQFVRIILRTGQPGQAPEHDIITEYDINDYREKSDLTAQKLLSALTTSLRAYQDLRTIENLVMTNDQLELRVAERNQELTHANQALKQKIEEKQAITAELQENQQKLQSIINNSPSIIYLKDIEGRYLLINQPFEQQFCTKGNSITGKTSFDLFPQQVATEQQKNDQQVLETAEATQFEEHFPGEDGLHTYLTVKFPLLDADGNPYRICGISTDITDRIRDEEVIRQTNEGLAEAQRIADLGNWQWQLDHSEIEASEQLFTILGLSKIDDGLTYAIYTSMVHRDDQKLRNQQFEQLRRTGEAISSNHRIIRPDGEIRHICEKAEINALGDTIIGTLQDVTMQRLAESRMRTLSMAIEQTADIVMITDQEGIIEYVNPAFEETSGFSRDEVIHNKPSMLRSGKQNQRFYRKMWLTILDGEVFSAIFINRKKNGTIYYEEKTITPLKDSHNKLTHFVSTGKDITERMESERALHHMAHHDALTGLPNRTLLNDRLQQALSRVQWHDRHLAIILLDLDGFKLINDTLGHNAGDKLLKVMSERLLAAVREGDTVARLGGDEFAIILNDIASQEDVKPIADTILKALAQPFHIVSRELYVTASMGISLVPSDGLDSETLLKKADVAMYHAKDLGKNNYQFYTSKDEEKAIKRLSMETDLRHALERDELQLHYQPQFALDCGEFIGTEALLRWQHPQQGFLTPFHFISLMEETGLIIPVSEWILDTACRQAKEWLDQQLPLKRVAINLSPRHFQDNRLLQTITTILDKTGLPPQYLELEITEGLLIDNVEHTSQILMALQEMGAKISIDDFGTGYSSMSYLKSLPIDTLKIDQSFIRGITSEPEDEAIATAIIKLAHSLKLRVIAEGVETTEQLQLLHSKGCDEIQGYLFGPPLPAEVIEKTLSETENWRSLLQTSLPIAENI